MASRSKIRITKFKNRSGNTSWRVTGTIDGERIRRNFATHAEALNEKQNLANLCLQESRFRPAVTTLTDAQLAEAQDAFERLNGNHSLRKAVDFFLKNHHEPETTYNMEDVLEDFYADKRTSGVRERTIVQLESSLSRFSKFIGGRKLHEINLEDLQQYMQKHKWARKTRNNVRADLHNFFEWCRAKPRVWIIDNPAHDLPKFKFERGIPEILDVKTCRDLMKHVNKLDGGELAPYFALALFAGIRPQFPDGELGKLVLMKEDVWKLIDLPNKVIRIPPEISKTTEYRTIDIQPNLARWLAPWKGKSLFCYGFERMYKEVRKKFSLGHDVLRHSFISYHVAKYKSVGGTALQAGNTEAVVRRYYLKMVAEKEANAFWRIGPGRG